MGDEHSYEALDLRLNVLESKMEKLETKIDKLINVLQQGQGVIKTLKTIFYVTAPLIGAIIWIKEHVKL